MYINCAKPITNADDATAAGIIALMIYWATNKTVLAIHIKANYHSCKDSRGSSDTDDKVAAYHMEDAAMWRIDKSGGHGERGLGAKPRAWSPI